MGIYYCSCDETPKLEFVHLSSKMGILAALGVQNTHEHFDPFLIKDHAHFLKHKIINIITVK